MDQRRASQIVREFSGEDVIGTTPITDRGLVNQIFVIETRSKKFIIRTDQDETSTTRFAKEKWCVEASKMNGILTPEVYEIDIEEDHPYMIMEYIDGVDGDKFEDPSLIWHKLGEYAAKIYEIPVEGFGENMTSPGVFDGSWRDFLEYNVTSLNRDDTVLMMGVITVDQSKFLRESFEKLATEKLEFRLSHDDLSLKNTIVRKDGSIYLIDWGSANVAPAPHTDILEILHSSLNEGSEEFKQFLTGYGFTYAKYEEIKDQMRILEILVRMDKLRWAIDRKPDRIEHFAGQVRSLVSGLDK